MAPRQSRSSEPRSASDGAAPSGRDAGDPAGSRRPDRHLEIETKLEIGPNHALPPLGGRRSLVAAGLLTAADPLVFELDAVYFDTDELDLLRSRLTLRRRTGGEDAGWHLKLPAAAGARTEIGLPLEAAPVDPLQAIVPAALADLVQGAGRGRALRPVARIRNHRTVRRLLDAAGEPLVEVADDQVTATPVSHPGSPPGEHLGPVEGEASRWRELEVEVVRGTPAHLEAVVTLLRGAGATPASSASKLGRALGVTADPPGRKPKTAGAAVLLAVGRVRDSLISSDRALREGTGPALHDARASARRLRCVLGVYRSLFTAGATRQLRGALREYVAVLAPARQLEVLRRRLDGQLVDEPAEYAAAAAARIDAAMDAAVPAALARVQEFLRSEPYLSMLRELDGFLADPPLAKSAKAGPAGLIPPLAGAWAHLRELAARAGADAVVDRTQGTTAFHDVRKAAKSLRYAAEAVAPALGEDAVVFAAAVEEVQEVLGERADAVAAAAWLAEIALDPATDGVAGFVFGRLHAFEQATADGTIDDFADAFDRVADGELPDAVFG